MPKMTDSIAGMKKSIIDTHLSKGYGDLLQPLDVDHILHRYQLFPNEALYLVDCAQAQLEPLSANFGQVIGIDRPHKNDISLLLEHSSNETEPAQCQWVLIILSSLFQQSEGFSPEQDVFKCLYKTHDGRTLLKCTTALMYDSNGVMRYSLGKLIDLSGLLVFPHFGIKYEGPNQERMYLKYQDKVKRTSGLTSRESEILTLIGTGLTSEAVADKLFISSHTVDTHRRNIIEKLEVKTAFEAYCKSKNLGWL